MTIVETIERSREMLGIPEGTMLLTFDDGPVAGGQTARLLDVLAAHNVRAAFCMIGQEVERCPEECRRVVGEGHLLANHTYRHLAPWMMDAAHLRREIEMADEAYSKALGYDFKTRYFRPPGGMLSARVRRVLPQVHKRILPISFFAWDTTFNPMLRSILPHQILLHAGWKNGGIYLLHEAVFSLTGKSRFRSPNRSWVPEVVDEILTRAKAKGMIFPEPSEVLESVDEVIRDMVMEPIQT